MKKLNLNQVIEKLGKSRQTIYRYMRQGRLTAYGSNGSRFFKASEVDNLAAEFAINPPKPGRPSTFIG